MTKSKPINSQNSEKNKTQSQVNSGKGFQSSDIFDEEFDKNDIIESSPDLFDISGNYNQSSKEKNNKFVNNEEVSEILANYNDDLHKTRNFKFNYLEISEGSNSDEEFKEQHFKDFLVLPKISGKTKISSDSSRIPKQHVIDSKETIEISDDPKISKEQSKDTPTVIINRNELNEIINIEVLCSCGERTIINFDYDND